MANLGLAGVGLGVAARADIGATLLHVNPISLICNVLGEEAPGGGALCPSLEGLVGLIPADLLDAFFGTSALSAATSATSATSSKPAAGSGEASNPTLVPGLDSVIDNLAGMLAVN